MSHGAVACWSRLYSFCGNVYWAHGPKYLTPGSSRATRRATGCLSHVYSCCSFWFTVYSNMCRSCLHVCLPRWNLACPPTQCTHSPVSLSLSLSLNPETLTVCRELRILWILHGGIDHNTVQSSNRQWLMIQIVPSSGVILKPYLKVRVLLHARLGHKLTYGSYTSYY